MKDQQLLKACQRHVDHVSLQRSIYEMRFVKSMGIREIASKTGYTRSSIYRFLSIFALENPQIADQMKKDGKNVTPKDYQDLKAEITQLKSELSQEKLRADFYEEMLAFGKEVYGIDLKKAGTK